MRTSLSVNLNKIAVLRNSRGGDEPSLSKAARTVIAAGADGITLHPRPDCRHVRPDDVLSMAEITRGLVELNIEGNPFAGSRPGYPGFFALIEQARPTQVTLVPDGDGQITSDHGFDLSRDCVRLAPVVARCRELGCRVSVFVDADASGFSQARAIGVDRVELYTGPFASAHASGQGAAAAQRYAATARSANQAGLSINAGHDLSQDNLGTFLDAVDPVSEVSIGHALIAEALYQGLAATVGNYLSIIRRARVRPMSVG
jgi:pyridoxine 5-phosphate synthase